MTMPAIAEQLEGQSDAPSDGGGRNVVVIDRPILDLTAAVNLLAQNVEALGTMDDLILEIDRQIDGATHLRFRAYRFRQTD
jgi:hypothetical protein